MARGVKDSTRRYKYCCCGEIGATEVHGKNKQTGCDSLMFSFGTGITRKVFCGILD